MYMADQEEVSLALGLSLGSGSGGRRHRHHHLLQPREAVNPCVKTTTTTTTEPSLTLSLTGAVKKEDDDGDGDGDDGRALYYSAASSAADDDVVDGCSRKKLRLTKEQSALLEDRFKEHSTLNPKQKAALARQLKLRPRQVEVWFQNRRARTKLKQTEVDCELLRRCCETLTEENRRLHRELQHLRALHHPSAAAAFFMPAAATLSVCPSCDVRLVGGASVSAAAAAADRPAAKRSFFTATKSAAC